MGSRFITNGNTSVSREKRANGVPFFTVFQGEGPLIVPDVYGVAELEICLRRALGHMAPATWQALGQRARISTASFALPSEGSSCICSSGHPCARSSSAGRPVLHLHSNHRANCTSLTPLFARRVSFPGAKAYSILLALVSS